MKKVLKKLCETWPNDDKCWDTLLLAASKHGHLEAIKVIFNNNKGNLEARTSLGETAKQLAEEHNRQEALDYLNRMEIESKYLKVRLIVTNESCWCNDIKF